MSLNVQQGNPLPRATLIDLMIVLVICSAITIFVFWIATRFLGLNLFEQLPQFIIGTYWYFTALGTGSVGLGAAVIQSLRRQGHGPDYVKLVAICEAGIVCLIVGVVLLHRFAVPPPPPPPPPPPGARVKTFTPPDVSRLGAMREIRVTLIDNSPLNQKSRYIIEYRWTGSGGTQNGSQSATFSFKGNNNATIQGVTFPIDRSHCYYGGGNLERKEGELQSDPNLIVGVEISLSEVVGRMGVC